jgi:hypothetical protein
MGYKSAKIQEQEGLLIAAVNYGKGEKHTALSLLIIKFANRPPKQIVLSLIFSVTILVLIALLTLFDCQNYGYLEVKGSRNRFLAI